jgi:nucleotide-binding universal stress UspA family protein
MIILAHDGSIYGDWVVRYGLRFAADEVDRKLLVLHVLDGKVAPDLVEAKFRQLAKDCTEQNVDFVSQLLPLGKSVHRSLRQAIPHDPDSLLICGTRVKPNRRALLTGSVAEKLLRTHQCPVLALRVVQPGLLGNPHELMLALAGHGAGLERVWPVFRRLAPHLRAVHLFRALPVHHFMMAQLTSGREHRLYKIGHAHLDQVCAGLSERLPERTFRLDRRVTITGDWPNEVLVQASRLKTQMVLLGISERSLAHRVFHGAGLERVLRQTSCDVGVYRGP